MAKFAKVFAGVRRSLSYLVESAVLDFTIELDQLLQRKNVTRAELGRRIGTSQAYISQVLSGQRNLTVKTMATLAQALDCKVRIELEPLRSQALEEIWHRIGTASQSVTAPVADSIKELHFSPADIPAANDEWLTVKKEAA